MTTRNLWDAAKAVPEGSLQQYNPTSRNKKTSNRRPNFTPKTEEEQKAPKINRREKIIKIQAERNERKNSKD